MAVGRSVLERAKKTLPLHDKRSLKTTFPHTPSFNDDDRSLLALSSLKRGVWGVNGTTSFYHASVFFAHPGIKTFFYRFYSGFESTHHSKDALSTQH